MENVQRLFFIHISLLVGFESFYTYINLDEVLLFLGFTPKHLKSFQDQRVYLHYRYTQTQRNFLISSLHFGCI